MKKYLVPFFGLFIFSSTVLSAQLIDFSSKAGSGRLDRSRSKADFYKLANQFESQTNRIFCGPTSVAIVLNAMRADKLRSGEIKLKLDKSLLGDSDRTFLNKERDYVFNRYTQNNVFDLSYRKGISNSSIKQKEEVLGKPAKGSETADWGLQLRQLAKMFTAHGVETQVRVVADGMSESDIKKEIISNLKREGDFVVVNYARKALGQEGGGHISPVGAYDKRSDSFLVMDVNPNTDDWVWVKARELIQAMRTFDTVENRGYLLLKDGLSAS